MAKEMPSSNMFQDVSREIWRKIIKGLEKLIKFYEIGNLIISFGYTWVLRRISRRFLKGKRILEIGPGPGNFIKLIYNPLKYDITALEPSQSLAYYVKGKYPNVDVLLGVAEKLPFNKNSFDCILCIFSFRDFFNKKSFLVQAYEILKPTGLLIIADTNNAHTLITRILIGYIRALGRILSKVMLLRENPYEYLAKSIEIMPSIENIIRLLKKIGFNTIRISFFASKNAFILVAIK